MPTRSDAAVVPGPDDLPGMCVEARVGSANHRNRGGHDDPCRCVWGGNNQPADGVISAQAVLLGEFADLMRRVCKWADVDNIDARILIDRAAGLLRTYDAVTGASPERVIAPAGSTG